MKVQRTIPPAAAPLSWKDLWYGLTGIFSGERAVRRLENELKAYFRVDHVFLVSSGKAALTLILKALQLLSPRREVLIPAYTCYSVPSAILKARLKVALCDIDVLTFDFDSKLLEEAVNNQTLCVIPSHLFGIPSDMDQISSYCKGKGVFVVEDAAQAMGGTYKGNKLGTIGDVGFFSLGRGKNITCGSGGMVVTNSVPIAEALARIYADLHSPRNIQTLKEYGELVAMKILITPALYWLPSGTPFLKLGATLFYDDFPMSRLSNMKAAVLRNWQNHLVASNKTRAETATFYCEQLELNNPGREGLPHLRFPVTLASSDDRDIVLRTSRAGGAGISKMYPTPINEIPKLKATFDGKEFPSARKLAETLVTVPTHSLLTWKDKVKLVSLFEGKSIASVADERSRQERSCVESMN